MKTMNKLLFGSLEGEDLSMEDREKNIGNFLGILRGVFLEIYLNLQGGL